MKQFISFLTLLLAFLSVDAQQYRPMLKDGKRWCYYYTNNFNEGSFLYTLSGDTLIDGNKGYRLYATWIDQWTGDTISHGPAGAMYENGGRTYYISRQNRKMEICNMNLNVGDSIPFGKGVVTGTDYVYVMGNKLKRLTISYTFDPLLPSDTVYWVEGVGSSIEAESAMPLVTCYEDGRCIFTAKYFEGMPAEKTDVESGRSLLSEGRTWWYQDDLNHWYGYPKDYRLFIQGDTLVDGKRWRKVYSDHVIGTEAVYLKALREEDGKVYERRQDGEERLLFDFTMEIGDRYVPTGSDGRYMEVIAVDTMLSAGRPHRRLVLQQHVNGVETDLTCWIEGIGSDCGIDLPAFWSDMDAKYINSRNGTDYYPAIFLGCSEQDGKCLYGDLPNITTDIPVIHRPSSSTSLYDLQGRRQAAPPAKGIYVKDGQKVIVK